MLAACCYSCLLRASCKAAPPDAGTGLCQLVSTAGAGLLQIKRTEGVSTTDLVGRMLTCTRVNHWITASDTAEKVRAGRQEHRQRPCIAVRPAAEMVLPDALIAQDRHRCEAHSVRASAEGCAVCWQHADGTPKQPTGRWICRKPPLCRDLTISALSHSSGAAHLPVQLPASNVVCRSSRHAALSILLRPSYLPRCRHTRWRASSAWSSTAARSRAPRCHASCPRRGAWCSSPTAAWRPQRPRLCTLMVPLMCSTRAT